MKRLNWEKINGTKEKLLAHCQAFEQEESEVRTTHQQECINYSKGLGCQTYDSKMISTLN